MNGNPVEQTIFWLFTNQTNVADQTECCNDQQQQQTNKTFTLFDLITSDALNELNSNLVTVNDEDRPLVDDTIKSDALLNDANNLKEQNSKTTAIFMNKILDQLTNGDELKLLCWSLNLAGIQQNPCTIHIATSLRPSQLIDCQVYNTTSHSLAVECEQDKENQWRIDQPITYQLDVFDDQSNVLLFQLINNRQPNFELNQLPPGKSLRLTIYSTNKKGKSNTLNLRTSTLVPSKWRAGKFY